MLAIYNGGQVRQQSGLDAKMITAEKPEVYGRLRLSFSVFVEPDGETFYAHCPAFKGIHVDGKTEEEALENAVEAVGCYLTSMVERGDPLPVCPEIILERSAPKRSRLPRPRRFEAQWPSLQACGTR